MSLKPFLFEWLPRTLSGASANITFCEGGPMDEKKRQALIECDYGDLNTRDLQATPRHAS
jgi:hypothetical protein